ncbi:hypothetical protein QT829_22460, partial [Xanthomonas citri pv. citri]
MHPMLHDAITACMVHTLIGSLVWMWVYCRGHLTSIYATRVDLDDPVRQFIETHVGFDPGGPGVTSRAMFEAFTAWCKANDIARMIGPRSLDYGMETRGFAKDKSRIVYVYRECKLRARPNIIALD